MKIKKKELIKCLIAAGVCLVAGFCLWMYMICLSAAPLSALPAV